MELDALSSIAEVGAAIAGFATLASFIRRDGIDAEAVFGVVQCSLFAVVFALIPMLMFSDSSSSEAGLRLLSLVYFFCWTALWIWAANRVRAMIRDGFVPDSRIEPECLAPLQDRLKLQHSSQPPTERSKHSSNGE